MLTINDRIKNAWLDYTSANQYKSEYFLIKYLELLPKSDLEKLLEKFGREHSHLIMKPK